MTYLKYSCGNYFILLLGANYDLVWYRDFSKHYQFCTLWNFHFSFYKIFIVHWFLTHKKYENCPSKTRIKNLRKSMKGSENDTCSFS